MHVDIVAHLVPHDPAHLGQIGALGEHDVAHRHPCRTEQARDIGCVAVRLFRAVVDEYLVVRRASLLRQFHHRVAHRSVRRRRIGVEQRLDQDRRDDQHEDHGHGRQSRPPGPPQASCVANDEIEAHDQQAHEDGRNPSAQRRLAQPAGQRLFRQPVLRLTPPALIDGPGQGQNPAHQQIDDAHDQRDQFRSFAPPLQPIADAAENARADDDPGHDDADDRAPQQQPVAAARIGDRPLQVLRRNGRQPARGLGRGVDAHDGVLPDARRGRRPATLVSLNRRHSTRASQPR